MTKRSDVFKCELCGNIVEVLHSAGGDLVCCGKEMVLMAPNTVEASKEKHIPVIESMEKGIKVKVGSVAHPMEEKHYIEWIDLIADDKVYRKFLKPGDLPEAEFCMRADKFTAKAYCNIHGLWKA